MEQMFDYGNRQRSMHCREFPILGGGFSFGGAATSKPATGGLSITPLGGGTVSLSVALSVHNLGFCVCLSNPSRPWTQLFVFSN